MFASHSAIGASQLLFNFTYNKIGYIDWVRVRQYSLVEPTASIGTPSDKWDEFSASFNSLRTFNQTHLPVIKADFKTDSTNSLANVSIEGSVNGTFKSLGLEYDSGTIKVRTKEGTNVEYPAIALGGALANTWYTAEFELSLTDAKVFVYQKGTQRPANPAYTFAISDWSPQLRFYNRKGNTSIDNVSVSAKKEVYDYLYDNLNRLTKVTDIEGVKPLNTNMII